jgi:hypothetical protein
VARQGCYQRVSKLRRLCITAKLTAQVGTAEAAVAQFAELPGTHAEVTLLPEVPSPALGLLVVVGLGPPEPLADPLVLAVVIGGGPPEPVEDAVGHDPPVAAALTQPHTALADAITAGRDACGQALRTQGRAAWEIAAC